MARATVLLVIDLPEGARRALEESGVEFAVLFGSAAAGRARPDSDLDIGVGGADLPLRARLQLAVALERALRREVDLVTLEGATPLLRFEVAGGRRLWERRPGAFASFAARAVLEFDDVREILLRCGRGMLRRLREVA